MEEKAVNPYESPRIGDTSTANVGAHPGMKVKIFTKMNPKNKVEPVNTELESEINDWLGNKQDIVIRHIQQSAGGGSMGPFLFCITIWYESGG